MSNDDHNLPIPGTLLLIDHNASSSNKSDIILYPQPSKDYNDPLNWKPWRKQLAFWCLMLYTTACGFAACSIFSIFEPLQTQKGIAFGTLNAGTGYMFLLLGWGGLFTQPMALTFGKRWIYLLSQVVSFACAIWIVYINSEGQWLANNIIKGFFNSPVEMLIEVSIADMFYAHERGFYMGIYITVLVGSNFLAPTWAGYAAVNLGYIWVFWLGAIQLGSVLVFTFFFMEETNYIRTSSELDEHREASHAVDAENDIGEKNEAEVHVIETAADLGHVPLEGKEYSFFYKIALYRQRYTTLSTLWAQVYRPLIFFRYPVVLWAGFLYGSSVVWYNVINATASLILTTQYNFGPSGIGLFYLGPTFGAVCSFLYSGWFADKFLMYMTRRKGGIREPEDRLWLLSVNTVLLPAGLILWGVGAANQIHWFGLVIGGVLVGFTCATAGAFTLNYILDSYKDLGGEVVLTSQVIRNTISFAMGYAVTPWVTNMSLQNAFITAAMVGFGCYITFLPVIYYGKRWRQASAKSYWAYVKSSSMAGH